jgi:predicted 3-demethylubiquinone-9 3-methyltransferase (glyoxalase superfamily)
MNKVTTFLWFNDQAEEAALWDELIVGGGAPSMLQMKKIDVAALQKAFDGS